jgi:DeoR family transcriptional regulator, fructose operon transcriptional repressor
MYAEERQQAIAAQASDNGRVAVADLARRFGVTQETIRRDLDALAASGHVERVHGGAVPAGTLHLIEPAVSVRETSRIMQKTAIGRAALNLLVSMRPANVILDAGTTTGRLADQLSAGIATSVVTNSVTLATTLATRQIAEVQLLGGRVRGVTEATVGATTVEWLQRLRADVAFIGTNGFSLGHAFSTPDHSEAAVKRAMVAAAKRVVVVADSSKFGSEYFVRFAEFADVDVLITDTELPASALAALTDRGIEVVLA